MTTMYKVGDVVEFWKRMVDDHGVDSGKVLFTEYDYGIAAVHFVESEHGFTLGGASLHTSLVGKKGLWVYPKDIIGVIAAKPLTTDPRCVSCGEVAPMAEPNLYKPPKDGSRARFACWSCRTTRAWWLAAEGYEVVK